MVGGGEAPPSGPVPRVVVFSLKECPHCQRAKATLEEQGMAFEEISLTSYPEKRTDMLQLADRLSVPQIFVSGRHVGGNTELKQLLDAGKLKELFEGEPAALAADPRLRRPAYAPKEQEPLPEAPAEPKISIGDRVVEYPELVRLLLGGVEVRDRAQFMGLKTLKRCFLGSDLVDFLAKEFSIPSRDEALKAAQSLHRSLLFAPASSTSLLGAEPEGAFAEQDLYRFQAQRVALRQPLNAARRWRTPDGALSEAPSNPLGTLKRLKAQLSKLVAAHTDAEGGVDYIAMAEDPDFLLYDLAVAELQTIDLASLEPTVRKAYVINLYNAIVPHAFAKLGIPEKDIPRVTFFNGASYEFANGVVLSLNDLENGMLRGNRKAPFHLHRPFGASDAQRHGVLACDHRIHFALNCGAKSCPPVKWFTTDALDEELRVVAMAWSEQDDNVRVNVEGKSLWLSQICSWYSEDFGADKAQIAQTFVPHLRGEKRAQLEKLLAGGKLSIKHPTYDWSTNSRRAHRFTETCMRALIMRNP